MVEGQRVQGTLPAGGVEAAIAAMVGMVQARDPFTSGHEERVAVLAAAMARRLGRPDAEVRMIYLASLMHDAGKLAVPTEVLNKPGALSEAEFALVKTHVEAGWHIARRIAAPAALAEIVLQHHERLDGSGYPYGLRAGRIAIGAKILAVADVVEAMTASRPHRASRGLAGAIAELEANKGRLYDVATVDSCIALLDSDRRPGFAAPH
jgi:putative nucleotidyltransferase with HDIG domain